MTTRPIALVELRRTLLRRRLWGIDRFDAFYRVYVTGIFVAILTFLATARTGDLKVSPGELELVIEFAPAVVGLLFAVISAGGMRSGAGGGPLALEAAEARHVLTAPIDRGFALRGPALRKIRFGLYVGAIAGGVAGVIAFRRLPGSLIEWLITGTLLACLLFTCWNGWALIFSGLRLSRLVASAVGLTLTAASVFDLLLETRIAPATQLGRVALWPLQFDPMGLAGVLGVGLLAGAGLSLVGNTSIEAAQRRSRLISGIRFSALLGDVRMVVLTRRLLAHESIRSRPWLRLKPAQRRALAIFKRGWHGFLRWPARRILRVLLLGVAAGVALVASLKASTAFIFVAGGLLYVAALDVIDPMGQETDHQTFSLSFPMRETSLMLRHIPGAVTAMFPITLAAQAVVVLLVPGVSAVAGLSLAAASALSAVAGATSGTIQSEPPLLRTLQSAIPPELMGARVITSLAYSPAVATLGLAPLLFSRLLHGTSPASLTALIAIGSAFVFVFLTVVLVLVGLLRGRFGLRSA